MLKRTITFLSIKSKPEIEEEIRNLIRKQKFYPTDSIFNLTIFFLVEFLSRDYKIEVSNLYSGTEIKVTGKTNFLIELSIWIAFAAFLFQFLEFIFSQGPVDYVDLLMPLLWIATQASIFFFPIISDLKLIKSKLS